MINILYTDEADCSTITTGKCNLHLTSQMFCYYRSLNLLKNVLLALRQWVKVIFFSHQLTFLHFIPTHATPTLHNSIIYLPFLSLPKRTHYASTSSSVFHTLATPSRLSKLASCTHEHSWASKSCITAAQRRHPTLQPQRHTSCPRPPAWLLHLPAGSGPVFIPVTLAFVHDSREACIAAPNSSCWIYRYCVYVAPRR